AALERVYQAIVTLCGLLDDEGSDSRLDMTQWRLDVLTALRDAILSLDASFAGASSCLVRLHRFGEHARAGAAWQRLCALLDFEGDAARAQLQVRLAADGSIRSLDIVSLDERVSSAFYVGPARRLLRRLLLWLQGYRIGARDVVERWLEEVFVGMRPHIPSLLQLKVDLELYLGAMHWKALAERKGLAVCLPQLSDLPAASAHKQVHGLFNPLLLLQPNAPVAADLELSSCACTCITTGPNSGGKTRFLQALAFCQLFAQSGCFVPAREAVLRRASGLFVSLGEHAAADQEEGRLGMELVRIRRVFETSKPGALIVLDELCSGTNPSEGEEIFRMLLELLHEVGHEVHVTTHFLSFAERLTAQSAQLGLHFLQVELDADEQPTYRFVAGVATTSLAQKTAQRLGVTREQLRALLTR
ncbi:MAG TPA: DNA mismatch repair protein, partial [Polyangiales bacterium]